MTIDQLILSDEATITQIWYADTALGIMNRVLKRLEDRIRFQVGTHYSKDTACWRIWDGKRWAEAGSERFIWKHIDAVTRELYTEIAALEENQHERRRRARILAKQDRRDGSDRVYEYLSMVPDLRRRYEDFDQEHDLVNYLNGTLRKSTGLLQPHNPQDLPHQTQTGRI